MARARAPKPPAAATEAAGAAASAGFPVVGIGASAGGIEALTRLFEAMPADSGMAFVIVLHLDPTHDSQLAEILGHHTGMAVAEITDGMRIEPDHVYVIVPDSYLTVSGGRLRLAAPTDPRGHRYPVDVLFASLAEDQQERAICVVLSGTGSNGTQGLKEVKAQGGCVLVQDPETARFDGMPRSAIAAGMADQVLAPETMPEFLLNYARHDYIAAPKAIEESTADGQPVDGKPVDGQPALDPILALLRVRSGHEFRHYKRGTFMRRVHRRMGIKNLETLADYTDRLRTSPAEITALVNDLMISVTGFFRDPEAWKALDETVLAKLVEERESGASIRIWVPACASGEEAYSLAMLIRGRAEAAGKQFDLKVFATDAKEANLDTARSGVYPEAASATVPQDLVRRYFDKLDGTYAVRKELRELVVFAPQNLLRDPPFSRMDLITCRNLLIYLEPEAQKRVLALFHFALRQGGHLFLGNTETVGRQDDLFETVSKKWRLYRRLGPTRHDIVDFPLFPGSTRPHRPEEPAQPDTGPPARLAEVARRALLDRFAPASVLIDRKGRALWFHGPTGDYLEPPPGEPSRDLLAMAREGLGAKLRGAVRQSIAEDRIVGFNARVRQGETLHAAAVTVAPVAASPKAAGLLLVSFEKEQELPASLRAASPGSGGESGGERALEEELNATRAELQSTAEQMESANEELKASNEEITSMNEELQSTNEELETSKEELQSFNEELHTVNNQLQHKIQDLENITNDLNNLLSGAEIATVFLDTELRIKWFSPASEGMLDLVSSDIGRPIGNFAWKVADENLLRDAETVLAKLSVIEAGVRSDAGQWYLRRVLPYRTQDNRIAGVVVAFIDISERKRAEDAVNEARVYAEAIVGTVRQPLLILDRELHVRSANLAFYHTFRAAPKETEGRLVYDLGNGQWDIPELRRLLTQILPEDKQVTDFAVEHDFETLGRRTMLLNARRLSRGDGRNELILIAIEDITERQQANAHRETLIGELSHRVKNMLATVQAIASQTLRQSDSLDTYKTAFEGRLHALARAHDLLVEEDWTGAEIGRLARRTLEPFGLQGDRITLDGPRLVLRPQAGVTLVMILHELTTNAAKYGALSKAHGRLDVTWRLDGKDGSKQVRLHWIETDGPRVEQPSRAGFGTGLIERSAAYELHGGARLEFREDGLRCELSFPWEEIPSPAEPDTD